MEPLDYLRVVLGRWRVVVAVTLTAIVAAWVMTPAKPAPVQAPTSYTAQTTLVRPTAATASTLPMAFVKLYATKGDVPTRTAKALGGGVSAADVAQRVTLETDDTTGSVTITASGDDAESTVRLADVYAATIIRYVDETAATAREAQIRRIERALADLSRSMRENRESSSAVLRAKAAADATYYDTLATQLRDVELQGATAGPPFTVLQEAVASAALPEGGPRLSAPTGRRSRLLLGGLAGLLAGIALALVVARVDTRLRTRADVQAAFGLPVLAVIPRLAHRRRRGSAIATVESPGGAVADAFRALRSALLLLSPRPLSEGNPDGAAGRHTPAGSKPQVFLVTSARAGEGKTTSVVNLAACFAETGRRVLVIDCDVRNPMAHQFLDVAEGAGITDLPVAGGVELSNSTSIPRVRLIQAGSGAFAHVAVSLALPDIVAQAREVADVVLIDSPPVLAGTDAVDAMGVADAVLLICRAGRTSREQAERTRELVARVGVPVHGVGFVASAEFPLSRILPMPSERRPPDRRWQPSLPGLAPSRADLDDRNRPDRDHQDAHPPVHRRGQ